MVWDRGWWNKKLLNGKRSAAASVAERGVSSATASPGTTPTDMETASSEVTSTGEPLCPPPPPPAPLPDPAAPGALEEVPGPPDPNVQLTLEGFTLDEVLLVNSPPGDAPPGGEGAPVCRRLEDLPTRRVPGRIGLAVRRDTEPALQSSGRTEAAASTPAPPP